MSGLYNFHKAVEDSKQIQDKSNYESYQKYETFENDSSHIDDFNNALGIFYGSSPIIKK